MKLFIRCGGIIRSGPERDLIDTYLKRGNQLARQKGYPQIIEDEVDLKRCKDRHEETQKILGPTPNPDLRIFLDERGKSLKTYEMANKLNEMRRESGTNIQFVIGPADGFDTALMPSGAIKWRLGAQTWPHKLLRAMLAEQVYRIYSIWAGTPYHRE